MELNNSKTNSLEKHAEETIIKGMEKTMTGGLLHESACHRVYV